MGLSISFYNDIKYTKDDFMNRDRDFFGNGVVRASDFELQVPEVYDGTFQVGQGVAWVDGYRIALDSAGVKLAFLPADPINNRIDIVQIGHDDVLQKAVLNVKKGVPAGDPPEDVPIEPGADYGFIKLFAIQVVANASTISASNVEDRRTLVPLNVSGTQISFDGAVSDSLLGKPDGIATLGADGKVPTEQLPIATGSALGGVKQGTGMAIDADGTISVLGTTARTDVAQTWTALQKWATGQTFEWSAINGKPTTVDASGLTDALKKTGDTMTGALGMVEGSTLAGRESVPNYDQYLSSADVNGTYTVLTLKRPDGTTYFVSTLTNPKTSGGSDYQMDTWQFYDAAGTTVVKTHVWSLMYDTNGKISQKVMSS